MTRVFTGKSANREMYIEVDIIKNLVDIGSIVSLKGDLEDTSYRSFQIKVNDFEFLQELLSYEWLKDRQLVYFLMASSIEVHERESTKATPWSPTTDVKRFLDSKETDRLIKLEIEVGKDGQLTDIRYKLVPSSLNGEYEWGFLGAVFVFKNTAHKVANIEQETKPFTTEIKTPVHTSECGIRDCWEPTATGGFLRPYFVFILQEALKVNWSLKRCPVCFPE